MSTATAGDDHLIVKLVKSLGQSAADAGTAAGDEDSVAGELKWTPDLGPAVKVGSVLLCFNRWSERNDEVTQEV
jgi:hypothetical protein